MTALLFAARDGQMDAARALIAAGANVNDAGTGEKMTPLVMAIANGHYDLGKFFLEQRGGSEQSQRRRADPLCTPPSIWSKGALRLAASAHHLP